MAATKQQGQWFGLFLIGITAACAGAYAFSSGIGKAALLAGLVLLGLSFLRFLRLKPLEGETAEGPQPAAMKAVGLLVTAGGWLLVLLGLHLASGVMARMAFSLIGLAVSLVGVLVILPTACNKNAIWKA